MPVDLVIPRPRTRFKSPSTEVDQALERFAKIYAWMRKNQEATFRRTGKLYSGKPSELVVGDLIWWLGPKKTAGVSAKLQRKWTGPWRVSSIEVVMLWIYSAVGDPDKRLRVHRETVRRYYGEIPDPDERNTPPVETDPLLRGDGKIEDDAAEELYDRKQFVDPDALAVPLHHGDEEGEEMVDLAQKKKKTREPTAQVKRKAQDSGEGDPEDKRQVVRGHKRSQEDVSGPEAKEPHRRGEKRAGETLSKPRTRMRVKLKDYLEPSTSKTDYVDGSKSTLDSEDETMNGMMNNMVCEVTIEGNGLVKQKENYTLELRAKNNLIIPPWGKCNLETGAEISAANADAQMLFAPRLKKGLQRRGLQLMDHLLDADTGPVAVQVLNCSEEAVKIN